MYRERRHYHANWDATQPAHLVLGPPLTACTDAATAIETLVQWASLGQCQPVMNAQHEPRAATATGQKTAHISCRWLLGFAHSDSYPYISECISGGTGSAHFPDEVDPNAQGPPTSQQGHPIHLVSASEQNPGAVLARGGRA